MRKYLILLMFVGSIVYLKALDNANNLNIKDRKQLISSETKEVLYTINDMYKAGKAIGGLIGFGFGFAFDTTYKPLSALFFIIDSLSGYLILDMINKNNIVGANISLTAIPVIIISRVIQIVHGLR